MSGKSYPFSKDHYVDSCMNKLKTVDHKIVFVTIKFYTIVVTEHLIFTAFTISMIIFAHKLVVACWMW